MHQYATRDLTEKEVQLVTDEHGWLQDEHMNIIHSLLKIKYPQNQGLQDTIRQEDLKWYIPKLNQDYIQILNLDRTHWVVITNICPHSNPLRNRSYCYLFDSKNFAFNETIFSLIEDFHAADQFTVLMMNCQQQPNNSDCGVFSIANCIALASGYNPCLLHYINHRTNCLHMLMNKQTQVFEHRRRNVYLEDSVVAEIEVDKNRTPKWKVLEKCKDHPFYPTGSIEYAKVSHKETVKSGKRAIKWLDEKLDKTVPSHHLKQ